MKQKLFNKESGTMLFLILFVLFANAIQAQVYYDDLPPAGTRKTSYVWSGYKWNKCNITYYFENGTPDMTNEKQAVQWGFSIWASHTNLTFTEVFSSGSADIIIKWASGDHGDGAPFSGAGSPLAHAFYPDPANAYCGDIHFNEADTWTDASRNNDSNPRDLVTIAAHEIGHALGLQHSGETDALMHATYKGSHRWLHSDDINGIRSIYPYEITGPSNLCSSSSGTYSYNGSGASSYTWSVSGGIQITSGQGTSSVTVQKTSGNGIAQVCISTNNGCSTCKTIITAVPPQPSFVTADPSSEHTCWYKARTEELSAAAQYEWSLNNFSSVAQVTTSPNWEGLFQMGTYTTVSARGKNVCGFGSAYTETIFWPSPGEICDSWKKGLDEPSSITVFPNPASGSFELSIPSGEARVTLRSLEGQLIKNYTVTGSRAVLDISDVAQGTYFVAIHTKGEVINKKVQIIR